MVLEILRDFRRASLSLIRIREAHALPFHSDYEPSSSSSSSHTPHESVINALADGIPHARMHAAWLPMVGCTTTGWLVGGYAPPVGWLVGECGCGCAATATAASRGINEQVQ
ncbi:hypothetical protein M0804_003109 [Polistes exclamans]|nr:hypothetical protein M0804_003109 [Polistes exclamans]